MKKILIAVVLIVIAGFFVLAYKSNKTKTISGSQSPTIAPTSVSSQSTNCTGNQLNGTITTEGAAGSIYGKLELTNISKKTCAVELGDTVGTLFDPGVTNIALSYVQIVKIEHFALSPMAKVYSQVRIPNGPQCQSGIAQKQISFLYNGIVTFKPEKVTVQACVSDSETTVIDMWPLSKGPITK